jgi:hypothetical protein
MRLTGKAEFVDDEALWKRITEERKFLESLIGKSRHRWDWNVPASWFDQ